MVASWDSGCLAKPTYLLSKCTSARSVTSKLKEGTWPVQVVFSQVHVYLDEARTQVVWAFRWGLVSCISRTMMQHLTRTCRVFFVDSIHGALVLSSLAFCLEWMGFLFGLFGLALLVTALTSNHSREERHRNTPESEIVSSFWWSCVCCC